MSAALPVTAAPAPAGRVAALRAEPLAFALLVSAAVTAARIFGSVDSDVAWQLWIAGRIHAGAHLYSDIIEINPPLWFWMALPVERLATFLNLRIEAVDVLAMGIIAVLSLAATNRLTHHIEPHRRALLLGYAALALLAMPWMHVGQREQIVLIGALPYAALIATRCTGRRVPRTLALSIGLASGLCFALKHYFLIVPAFLELWLLAAQQRQWRPARPETLAMLVFGASYAAAITWFEPDYLTKIVPLVRLAYGPVGASRVLFSPFALVGTLLLIAAGAHARRISRADAPLANALVVAALGFAGVYFIQFKGWPYHAIPLIGCSSLALAALLAESDTSRTSLRLLAPALLLLPLVLSAEEDLHPALPNPDLLGAVSGLRAGESVGFLTSETAIPWSVTLQGGYRYASRYMGFWMMRAIMQNEASAHPDPSLASFGREIVADTVSDFSCIQPHRIIVARPRRGEVGFDILPFFMRNARFSELLSHYRVRSRTSFETYELVSPLQPVSGHCRNGV